LATSDDPQARTSGVKARGTLGTAVEDAQPRAAMRTSLRRPQPEYEADDPEDLPAMGTILVVSGWEHSGSQ